MSKEKKEKITSEQMEFVKQMESVLSDNFWEESKTGTIADLSSEEMLELAKIIKAKQEEVKDLSGKKGLKIGNN